jgi:hypothetical protein
MIKTENDLQAFEVKDMNQDAQFIYLYDPNNESVAMFHSSGKIELIQAVNKNFPFGCINAWAYFNQLWQRSLLFNAHNIKFMRWVDPESFEPLSE